MDRTTTSSLVSECSFLIPEHSILSAWTEHAPFAFWLVEQLRPRTFVELGTHLGYSYFSICQVVQKLDLRTACYAVDTWKGDEHAGLYDESVYASIVELNQKYRAFSTLVRSTFEQAANSFAERSIDLLHIDGQHFYEDVKGDFEIWRPKMADNGIVLFHDTNVRERGFGVWRLFDELRIAHPTFEFLHGYGLGVVAVGQVPPALQPLFSQHDYAIRFARSAYSALGAHMSHRVESELASRLRAEEAARSAGEAEKRLLAAQRLGEAELARVQKDAARQLSNIKRDHENALARSKAEAKDLAGDTSAARGANEELIRLLSQQKRQTPVSVLPKFLRRKNLLARPNPAYDKLVKDYEMLALSPLFDAAWYRETYSDVVAAGEDVVYHYLQHGGTSRVSPGPHFDGARYLEANPDVKHARENPLVHLIRDGAAEKRSLGLLPSANGSEPPFYDRWVAECDTLFEDDRTAIRRHIASFGLTPLISVVMPVYNTPEGLLREAIDSVLAQLYPHWELCVADDASPDPHVAAVLRDYAFEPRIKWMRRDTNGHISAATNSALALAKGEFVALMDHDDILPEHALYEIAHEINRHPDADIIYSDEDRIDADGRRYFPYFKTEWNQELLYGHNMISHLGVYRRSLLERIGGLREGYEGSQDYDLALRAADASSKTRIHHIPAVLYHWRRNASEQSFSEAHLERCAATARRAVGESLARNGYVASVEPHPQSWCWQRVRRQLPADPPLISLIIPTKDMAQMLERCVEGILKRTDYPHIEIVIVDHESREDRTHALLAQLKKDSRVRVMPFTEPFNYSAINNAAAKLCNGSLIGLLNNDIDVIEPGWLKEMASLAVLPDVGVVGARLLYGDGSVQHAGVVLGVGGVAGHFCKHMSRDDIGYFGRAVMTSAVSAVTGACLLVKKSIFDEIDGLDAVHLPVAFNDVDFCLRVGEKGYRNIYTPHAELYHLESASRGSDMRPERIEGFKAEIRYMLDRWGTTLERDPYFNPNFSLSSEHLEFAFPSRRIKPWRPVKEQ